MIEYNATRPRTSDQPCSSASRPDHPQRHRSGRGRVVRHHRHHDTRAYLQLTGHPQIGGGDLHIAHALYGGALMMLALLVGWMVLGQGARNLAVVMGGIGRGLFLDEVGKFITKDNDYFYGPSAEIMYILVVFILVGVRIVRDFRPLAPQERMASATEIDADGVARGLADHRREIGLAHVAQARDGGADSADVHHMRALLVSAGHARIGCSGCRRRCRD